MIDNLENIIPLLVFQNTSFYEILIKKNSNNQVIKHYMIDNLQSLLTDYKEMKHISDCLDASVYIKLGSYSKEKLGYKILETLSKKLEKQELDYSMLVQESIDDLNSNIEIWVVNVDYKNVSINDVLRIKTVINDCAPNGRNIVGDIPTPNGAHIITRPFNTRQFLTYQDVCYKVEIKKNNPTILYSNIK
jgi:hypothetical protein